ncbi:MAG TPA: sigma-70 family RNA polymerase sigma factor [Polyangia bacterium]|nr:sigma-70 family RNA polymerase sigma factor [Polyangia bacterium]
MTRHRTSLLREPAALSASPSTERTVALDLASVYGSQRDFVWLTLQRMGVRGSDLEDVFQDVFMIVHKRLDSYRRDAKLSAWLYGICLRCVSRHRRRAFRRRERPEGLELEARGDGSSPWHAASEAPDAHLHEAEKQARLARLLDALEPEHRAMVVMYEIEELSCAQISTLTGVAVGTIHSRLHYARRKLAEAARRLAAGGGA